MSEHVLALLSTFAVSLVPALELRVGIPLGIALGLPPATATVVAILGSVLQIRLAVLAVAFAYRYSAQLPRVRRWLDGTAGQISRHTPLIRRWGWLGLALFVILPLPGTGVWGGAVLARVINLHLTGTWLGLSLGAALTGVLIGLGAQGILNGFGVTLP